jgi:broad specificity phosphatase PhoE
MPRLYLVRHGEAASGFDGHHDPGLSDLGRQQAADTAQRLAEMVPINLVSSPLLRARETASALEHLWQRPVTIEPAIAEIPSPTPDLAARTAWLRSIMAGTWAQAGAGSFAWSQSVIRYLLSLESDCVIFSHYVAINVAMGAACGDDRVVCFSPDNASVSVFDTDGVRLSLIEKGRERASLVG